MGMFDNVSIELESAPEWLHGCEEWQTKSLDCLLITYVINKDGRLIRPINTYESVKEEERPLYDKEIGGFKNPLHSVVGSMKVTKVGEEDTNYSGVLNFYGLNGEGHDVNVNAVFENGSLVRFDRLPSRY